MQSNGEIEESTMHILVTNSGSIQFIHSDELFNALKDIGTPSIRRASNVEPTDDSLWTATMRDGVIIGPFDSRTEALAAEVALLESRMFATVEK